jgi:DNA-binding transcriptional MocR family regulator
VFKTVDDVVAHMKKHAQILRPKFEIVLKNLEANLGGLGIAHWTKPNGGYFISLDLLPGFAKRTHALCKEAGLVMTGAGATYPYSKDPEDKNLRIAPSYPSVQELDMASKLLCISVKYAILEKLINQ